MTLVDRVHLAGDPQEVVLWSGPAAITREELLARTLQIAEQLREAGIACVALYADNSPDWILVDLACQHAGMRLVPVPLFFSDEQIQHALGVSGADALITDQTITAGRFGATPIAPSNSLALDTARMYELPATSTARLPKGTQKITFTSGTTGAPKGVCLSAEQQVAVAASIASTIDVESPRHLCILPLSTLLENLAGVYAPLFRGGTVVVPSLADVGLNGSSQLDIPSLLECIGREQPNSLILVPEILSALAVAAECGWRPPSSLHFVAVGGGKVSAELLLRARRAGLPAFEGYGLSECGSVVTLNVPAADRAGSVGRPLPHVQLHIVNNEIVVEGSTFLGYVDQPESWDAGSVRTGDLGRIDADGYVYINGRAKNQLITSFGRNLSPEWVESELLAGPLLQQAVVIGDARPWCVALLWPRDPATTDEDIAAWIRNANQQLPDYARIVDWRRLPKPMTSDSGLLTDNGRPRRTQIERLYGPLIEQLYTDQPEASNQ